ncbi:3769_t:CDS:2, partial [Gigaspora rosea]
ETPAAESFETPRERKNRLAREACANMLQTKPLKKLSSVERRENENTEEVERCRGAQRQAHAQRYADET